MSDSAQHLTNIASAALHALFHSGKVASPIGTMELLTKVITSEPHRRLAGGDRARSFRLTDLSRFESILESLSRNWEHGLIYLQRDEDNGPLTVIDVQLGPAAAPSRGRKRKRSVDEDADSAAGDAEPFKEEEHEEYEISRGPGPRMANLSKELKEVYAILQRSTAKGRLLAEEFRSVHPSFEPVCPHTTKEECAKARTNARLSSSASSSVAPTPPIGPGATCSLVHFRPIIRPHTDPNLGHCSYLNTCYSEPTYSLSPSIPPLPSSQQHPRLVTGTSGSAGALNANSPASLPSGLGAGGRGKEKAPCRYLHYEVDWDESDAAQEATVNAYKNAKREMETVRRPFKLGIGLGPAGKETKILPPQWINCDLRRFDYSVLGKFHAIMADPPWDIHMSLPYGTMTDDEMRAMPIPALQDEGLLFLWVTGRAMEVGRECMRVWGYTRVDEVAWVKTNQLQRVIRTGRTGHWLNHTKEHMLVGLKTHVDDAGNLIWPSWVNRGLDTDVIVSEVRETSRKPDEVYGMIERMCPGGRKVEIFGRKHNTRPGWLTLGNQLGQDQIFEEDLLARIKARYPERAMGAPAGAASLPAPPLPHLPRGPMQR